ncbi:copia-type polyprotein [Cucumis melo var. makuwa]|uniref:Copia-type polyprotein n=1 Tax=Cucumis melo var. makuwa TaxID=1194695 RepID=A0A5A7TZM8_CUCMM|nr:copia-type polyprotein [Cucumis melo var. makuwa]
MLDDKSEKHIFVGYYTYSKGYKFDSLVTKKTMVSRDVMFDEEALWSWNDDLEDYSIPSSFASSSERPRGMRSFDSEPLNYDKALEDDKWKIPMYEEIKVIKKNNKLELSALPSGRSNRSRLAVKRCIYENVQASQRPREELGAHILASKVRIAMELGHLHKIGIFAFRCRLQHHGASWLEAPITKHPIFALLCLG